MSDLWGGRSSRSEPDPGSRSEDGGDELWGGHGDNDAGHRGPWSRRGHRGHGEPGIAPSTRAIARALLLVIVVGGLFVGGSVGLDLFTVRSALLDAQSSVRDLRGSLGEVDVEASLRSLAAAEERVSDAERRAGRLTWTLASAMPIVGPSVEVTREVVEVAAASVEVARVVLVDGGTLVTEGLDLAVRDGQLDLTPLLLARDVLDRVALDRLTAARDALAEPRTVWLPEAVLSGRQRTLELADDTVGALERADALTAALPGFLGADGPRRYFIAMQTSAELRGTGGLIGFWGILSVDDGRITFGQSESYDPFDTAEPPEGETRIGRISSIGLSSQNPPDVDPEFLGRYALTASARSFPNINLDPDVPTVARAILDLFELQTGQRLDGVILLDPVALERLLLATGPTLETSDATRAIFGLDADLPTEGFGRFVTADIYDTLGFDRSDERKEVLRELGDTAFLRVVGGGWDSEAMVRAFVVATAERHLQVFAVDEAVQEGFAGVGAAGTLTPGGTEVDRFAVVANNVVGGKQDVHLGHRFAFDIDLDRLRFAEDGTLSADRSVTLEATVDNPLPSEGRDPYIIGNCYLPDRANRCFEGEPGYNRTWFSLWASPLTEVREFVSDDGGVPDRFSKTFRGLRVVDHFHLTPPESSSSFTYRLDGPTWLSLQTGSVVYSFSWWRQSKALPDLLDVRVTPPPGWAIGEVEVTGGGSGRGLGVHGDGEELVVEVVDGAARLHGTVTADTRFDVHLVDPAA